MAVAEQEQTEQQDEQQDGQSGSRTALKAAAAAAATGAATFAVRKALSHGEHDDDEGDDESPRGKSKQNQSAGSILSTAASSAWDSASEVVLPMAEDAAAAAGRYLAERAPDVVRERLVPRFIEAFNDAN